MGQLLSRFGIRLGTRISDYEINRIPIHHKCRNCGQGCDPTKSTNICVNAKFTRTGTKDQPIVLRPVIPNDKVRWSSSYDYRPIEFTSEKVRTSTKEYVDRDPRQDPSVQIPWNLDDRLCDRRSYHGTYKIIGHVPQNPCGRTGHFGPNHAADPIVTRWKRDENGQIIIHPSTRKPILQFVCIRRKDTNELAIPGGMVDKKEKVTDTLQREFQEETLNFPDLDELSKHNLLASIKDIFENGGIRIYCGYVDDPRNTDNSWMETTAYNFHDGNNEHLALINVHGGSDASSAFWHDLGGETPLFASHSDFLRRVAEIHNAHW
ncbi:unnamed protein product [Rotaria sp. Silwood2]|nr:unnamed protein product [Rotaria sp. Silwood2]